MNDLGYQYWVNYSLAGLHLDILVKSKNRLVGINLIGYPGLFVDALTLDDYKILSRSGVATFPLPYTYWNFDRERCIEELISFSRDFS
ncbi:MAG: hypothetical protein HRT61_06740 [Ekhidna sp.]|nr:hypothetical protein [Ekhidna sp.]